MKYINNKSSSSGNNDNSRSNININTVINTILLNNINNNQDIENEFADGTADLRKPDYPLFKKWTVEKLQKCNVHTKQQWLESVRLAREQYEALEAAIVMENPLVRAMRQ